MITVANILWLPAIVCAPPPILAFLAGRVTLLTVSAAILQATLAALDALRKAHETEVQREICKFKDEFIKKMQPGIDIGKLQKEHV